MSKTSKSLKKGTTFEDNRVPRFNIRNKGIDLHNHNTKSTTRKSNTVKSTFNKLKPLKPTRREKIRYVLFQIIKGINEEEKLNSHSISHSLIKSDMSKETIKKVRSTYSKLFGIFDLAKAGITTIHLNEQQTKKLNDKLKANSNNQTKKTKSKFLESEIGIIKIRRDKIDNLKTSFLFVDFLLDQPIIIRTLRVSGTLKSLIEKTEL